MVSEAYSWGLPRCRSARTVVNALSKLHLVRVWKSSNVGVRHSWITRGRKWCETSFRS